MPRIVNQESSNSASAGSKETYDCRIGDDGMIVLPVIGSLAAVGKTLAEIESGILAAYYPKYVKAPLPVYVSVLEYNTRTVSIAGAVTQPGIYALRPDQMSLVSLLMKAGGIVQQAGGTVQRGAAVIRIAHAGTSAFAPFLNPRRWEFGPLVQTCMLHESQIAGGAEVQADRITCRMVFEREGPLRTTGWLAVLDRDNVRARKWVDLACESQRSAFLHEVTAATGQTPAAGMHEKLVQLASVLGSVPLGQQVDAATQGCGWDAGDGGSLVTSLDTSPPNSQTVSKELVAPARFAELANGQAVTTLALPVKGLNIPFADVALDEGDSVVVEPSSEQFISVLGLVTRPGNYPYPPDAQYNLAQAIGFAGGLDPIADPRYVSIYRLKPDGDIASVTVQLMNPKKKQVLTEALAMSMRPGDIVSVEQTPRTRTNIFFDKVFRVSLGLYVTPDSLWNNK
jgi:protein involved in polysaccharide export with SLBB domain